jgi:hypothetical protein
MNEKSKQFAMMVDIYKISLRTYIWLEFHKGCGGYAAEAIRRLYNSWFERPIRLQGLNANASDPEYMNFYKKTWKSMKCFKISEISRNS